MVKQSSWSGNQDVDSLGQFLGLGGAVSAPHDQTKGVVVVLEEFLEDAIGLHGQLPRW